MFVLLDVQIATPSRARITLPGEIAESAVNIMKGKRFAYIEHFTPVLNTIISHNLLITINFHLDVQTSTPSIVRVALPELAESPIIAGSIEVKGPSMPGSDILHHEIGPGIPHEER